MNTRPKPRLVLDVKFKKNPFTPRFSIINLAYSKPLVRIPIHGWLKAISVFLIFSFSLFGFRGFAPGHDWSFFQDIESLAASSQQEEREALENRLSDLENQIDDYESAITQYHKQGKTLKNEISKFNAKIAKLNLQLKAVNVQLEKLDNEISATESNINNTESTIDFNKSALSEGVRQLYESEGASMVEVLFLHEQLSDFFGYLNNLVSVQDNLRLTVEKISSLRDVLLNQREQLGLERADAAELKTYRASQKDSLQKSKDEKDELLTTTKGQESRFQELLKETRKTAAQIRSRIFELLGGGELSFSQAYEFAKFAQQATGVRAALILAVLDKESALGQNVGRCSYKKAMHPKRDQPLFLEITASLGINPDSIMVSCPNSDGAYGGAMGPAQFIPSTWVIYKDRVAQITGSNPPSPWRHGDAFLATALYLKDAGAANGSLAEERKAAAKYYAGKRWQRHLWTYGERVISRAESLEKDIDVLNS
ncbi:MAG: lytic murein transglycosylase [Patescibacteria group bacterium]